MSEVTEELKQKILEHLGTIDKTKNRDISKAIGVEKKLVDKAVGELAKDGKVEYLYLNGSYVTLAEK